MTDIPKAYRELDTIKKKLDAQDGLRRRANELVVELLKAGEPIGKVTEHAPFSAAHVRTLRRYEAELPPARRGKSKGGT